MNNNKIAIVNVQLRVAGKVIELTLEQAKELKSILNETFPEPTFNTHTVYVDRFRPTPWPYATWMCGTSVGGYSPSQSSSFQGSSKLNTLMLEVR